MSMHAIRVGHPPQIEPIGVDLMICNHYQSFREIRLQPPVLCLLQLSSYAFISTHSDHRGAEPSCHCSNEETKRLFGKRHVSVVIVPVDEVEGRAEELSGVNTEYDCVDPCCEQQHAYALNRDAMLDLTCWMWFDGAPTCACAEVR